MVIEKPIIFFDGVCNLCNSSVQFVIKYDAGNKFLFAPLQGITAKEILEKHNHPTKQLNSFVLYKNDRLFTQSTAALKVARELKGWPSWLYAFIIVPVFIRDAVYNFIAKNRYKWFGKKDSCMLPSPALKAKFLD